MALVLYGHLISFVICARMTGDIYYPHIKLSNCPYVRTSSMATQLMNFPLFRYNLHKVSFALRSVAEDILHNHKKNINMWTEIAWGSYDPSHLCVYKQGNPDADADLKLVVTELCDWCKTTIQIYGNKATTIQNICCQLFVPTSSKEPVVLQH